MFTKLNMLISFVVLASLYWSRAVLTSSCSKCKLIIGAAFIILSNLLADILYAYLDPRVRYE